ERRAEAAELQARMVSMEEQLVSAGVDRAEMEVKLEDASKVQQEHSERVAVLEKAVVRAKKHKVCGQEAVVRAEKHKGADISRLLDHIAATLYYNSVEVKDGFDVFDVDCDGRLSMDDFRTDDFRTAIAQLELTSIRDEEIEALFASLDMNEDGFISMAEWDLGMKSADRGKVLAPKAGADPVRDLGNQFDAMRAELEASQLAAERMLVNLSAATAGQKG
ncbi:hypothetical protein T484DRAFT_1777010, partial [Baffinella frigidus]